MSGSRGSTIAVSSEAWPSLPLNEWQDTYATLHMWMQIVGKTRLAGAAMLNHWWQVTFYVTARGLTTSPIPYGGRTFEVEFDFIGHRLHVRTSDGQSGSLPLAPRTVAEFYREYCSLLQSLGIELKIWPKPVEVPTSIPFDQDREHSSYDPAYAQRFWRILVQADRVMQKFRGGFLGKSSPVHFFWGGPDLAVTRFSGRRAPPHPGGAPNVGVHVMLEAYSHEVSSAGFWPGGGPITEPVFYAYAYPEPAGYAGVKARPEAAYYHPDLREFILPYEAVRTASSPDQALLDFLQSTYEAAADHGHWDRAALERAQPRA